MALNMPPEDETCAPTTIEATDGCLSARGAPGDAPATSYRDRSPPTPHHHDRVITEKGAQGVRECR